MLNHRNVLREESRVNAEKAIANLDSRGMLCDKAQHIGASKLDWYITRCSENCLTREDVYAASSYYEMIRTEQSLPTLDKYITDIHFGDAGVDSRKDCRGVDLEDSIRCFIRILASYACIGQTQYLRQCYIQRINQDIQRHSKSGLPNKWNNELTRIMYSGLGAIPDMAGADVEPIYGIKTPVVRELERSYEQTPALKRRFRMPTCGLTRNFSGVLEKDWYEIRDEGIEAYTKQFGSLPNFYARNEWDEVFAKPEPETKEKVKNPLNLKIDIPPGCQVGPSTGPSSLETQFDYDGEPTDLKVISTEEIMAQIDQWIQVMDPNVVSSLVSTMTPLDKKTVLSAESEVPHFAKLIKESEKMDGEPTSV